MNSDDMFFLIVLSAVGLGLVVRQIRAWAMDEEARKSFQTWLAAGEVENRVSSLENRYPSDWERRRALVFVRTGGKCQRCGVNAGRLRCDQSKVWRYPAGKKLLIGATVHHVVPLSESGTHSLENLQLLCHACHAAEHPDNLELRRIASHAERLKEMEERGQLRYVGRTSRNSS